MLTAFVSAGWPALPGQQLARCLELGSGSGAVLDVAARPSPAHTGRRPTSPKLVYRQLLHQCIDLDGR
jgi:hypothetical protein